MDGEKNNNNNKNKNKNNININNDNTFDNYINENKNPNSKNLEQVISQTNFNPNIKNNSNIDNQMNETKEKNKQTEDLRKAIFLLLGKELKEYSMEKKKDFLAKKISPEIAEKAAEIVINFEANKKEELEIFKKDFENKHLNKGFFEGLFNIGNFIMVLVSTVGINYLFEFQREKRKDLFFKESERKLNDELKRITDNMKKEIGIQLNSFATKGDLNDRINEKIISNQVNSGLNFNLGSNKLRENVNNLKLDVDQQEKKIKEVSVKMENNSILLKQDVLNEIAKLIEKNNKEFLVQIIDLQNKLLLSATKNNFNNNINNSISTPFNLNSESNALITDKNNLLSNNKINNIKNPLINSEYDIFSSNENKGKNNNNIILKDDIRIENNNNISNNKDDSNDFINPLVNQNIMVSKEFTNINQIFNNNDNDSKNTSEGLGNIITNYDKNFPQKNEKDGNNNNYKFNINMNFTENLKIITDTLSDKKQNFIMGIKVKIFLYFFLYKYINKK